ncbi:hypothetical protein QBC32DRAFT_250935 [Pseudoneurospora amorphoporcata]|uniref:Uncharacterized protein n=1 Tax=Pseudoneurospora amorphoporcata TaxID=241081 RepID=A0AAN6P6J1_9PEZI|nr:hypothetical protein QBC32DRAFT_250935 [Pseudoneurospora amorphoporcata]
MAIPPTVGQQQGIKSQNSKDTASKLRGKRVPQSLMRLCRGPTCAVQEELDGHAKVAGEASQSYYH